MNKQFHNSTGYTGKELFELNNKAAKQNTNVYDIFVSNPSKMFTSDEVHIACHDIKYKTSTRRSITNLKNKGLLFDTGKRRKGDSGRMQVVWSLSNYHNVDVERQTRERYLRSLRNLVKDFDGVMSDTFTNHIEVELLKQIQVKLKHL